MSMLAIIHELYMYSRNFSSGQMLRVHSENDTTAHVRVPHAHNNSVNDHQSPVIMSSQPPVEIQPANGVNSNHNQFSLGSTELINGRIGKSDTLGENRKPSKVGLCVSEL